VAINGALSVDLTGQVCADSMGTRFYSGIGGQVDFIRGASMCPGGKPIIAMRATARDGAVSRIVDVLEPGAGVVTSRGDVHYVVTEYGVADLHGKSVRERAMALISVAHPDYRAELLAGAKQRLYVFADQIAPRAPRRKVHEGTITTRDGQELRVRTIRVTDECKMRDLFYSLSEDTVYKRWLSVVKRMPHHELQRYLDTDESDNVALVVETQPEDREPEIVAVGRYARVPATDHADVAFVMRDEWQRRGIGSALLRMLVDIARDRGVAAFDAYVLADNGAMLRVFHKSGLELKSTLEGGVYSIVMPLAKQGANR
jgi:RimJ/RimL family protein N-acetyltransferase